MYAQNGYRAQQRGMSFGTQWDSKSLLDATPITKEQQDHLMQVYGSLAVLVGSGAVGAWTDLSVHMGGILTALLSAIAMVAVSALPRENVRDRVFLALGSAFMMGLSIGPLIEAVLAVDAGLIGTAFVGTTAVFAAFSVSAVFANGSRLMYFAMAALGTLVSLSMTLALVNLFMWSVDIMVLRVYLGLAIFSLYVIADTQMILAKCARGDKDVVGHALELFVDFAQIFIRLLIILARNAGKKDNNRGSRSGNRR